MTAEPRFRILTVAVHTGVPAPTLRAWERRYGIPRPGRSDSAYRLYSDADIDEVRQLVQLRDSGFSVSEAARVVLAGGGPPVVLAAERPHAPERPPNSEPGLEPGSAVGRMLKAVMDYDPAALEAEVRLALHLGAPWEVFDRVLRPVLREVGARWESGALDIAGEHLAARVITEAVGELLATLSRAATGPRVLVACIDEEQHDLPLQGVALALLARGLRPMSLGQRTPPTAIGVAVSRLDPLAIVLSMTVQPPPLIDRTDLFRGYHEAAAGRPWYVGGAAASDFAEEIRAAGGEPLNEVGALCDLLEGHARARQSAPKAKGDSRKTSAQSARSVRRS